jgi:hypothetical protein
MKFRIFLTTLRHVYLCARNKPECNDPSFRYSNLFPCLKTERRATVAVEAQGRPAC